MKTRNKQTYVFLLGHGKQVLGGRSSCAALLVCQRSAAACNSAPLARFAAGQLNMATCIAWESASDKLQPATGRRAGLAATGPFCNDTHYKNASCTSARRPHHPRHSSDTAAGSVQQAGAQARHRLGLARRLAARPQLDCSIAEHVHGSDRRGPGCINTCPAMVIDPITDATPDGALLRV